MSIKTRLKSLEAKQPRGIAPCVVVYLAPGDSEQVKMEKRRQVYAAHGYVYRPENPLIYLTINRSDESCS
ncbi:MAG: hypothetical protein PSV18_13065 [Methylobacter sp.]|nr:hypothetical protein [Candidatus Methylobacter titanis]